MIDTDKAAQALTDFADGAAQDAAGAAADYFEQASQRIASSLERAALSGTFSFRDMTAAISRDLASIALREFVFNPLQNALGGKSGAAPEAPANPVNIVMNISGVSDVGGFQKSQGQISASLARAVSHGQKFI